MNDMIRKIVIAAGGTGGHIYPALALAERMKEKDPEVEIHFFGSSNRMEAQLIPSSGYPFEGVEMTGTNGGIGAKIHSAVSLLKAQKYCKNMLKRIQPDVCVGFGNYISVPLIMAAHAMHIPTMISEQNSFAGKANVMLAKYADAVETAYESSSKNLPKEKTRCLGNPDATMAARIKADKTILDQYGLKEDVPFVVFMMGSLGSQTVSEVIDESCNAFDESFQVLIASGKANDYQWKTRKENVHIVPYVEGAAVLKLADLAVLRAGATTLCEVCAIGTPSILIPSPFVPNNHQVYNAMELVKKGAAVMIEEKDLTAEKLASSVNKLMTDQTARKQMAANALSMSTPDAADQMIDWLEEIAG